MFQRFDQNNNISVFIKSILAQTDIPIVPFKEPENEGLYINNGYFYQKEDGSSKMLDPYIWGRKYEGLTTRFTSNNSYYDSETHYYLGEYLRAIRGNFNIDLMPYYNCFNNSYAKDVLLSAEEDNNKLFINLKVTNETTGYQVLLVPIKFNQQYTIAIDCPSQVLIKPIFYGNKGLAQNSDLVRLTNQLNKDLILNNPSFRKSTLYEGLSGKISDTNLFLYERFLRLAVQLPLEAKYSVVVLEGNYTTSNYNNIINGLEPLVPLNSPLSLLQLPTTYPVAFSNRLIEYLTQNVITSQDEIDSNIRRVQEYASSIINQEKNGTRLPYGTYTKGIWNQELRNYLYNLMKNTPYNKRMKLDYNGFVDKDTESILTRGQQV